LFCCETKSKIDYLAADASQVHGIVFLLFLMFSTPIVMGVVVGIVTERELKLLEFMKMMGLTVWLMMMMMMMNSV
jgi:hypothetical protein